MTILAQLTANGLIAGSIYALVAAGFSLIFATNRFLHFAHGITVAAGGYLLFALFELWGLPFALSCLLTVLLIGSSGCSSIEPSMCPCRRRVLPPWSCSSPRSAS